MKQAEIQSENQVASESQLSWDFVVSAQSHVSYHEMGDVPVVRDDVLTALEKNITTLENLQHRLQFIARENRYLLKI